MNHLDEIEMYKRALKGDYEKKPSVIKESTEDNKNYVIVVEHSSGHSFYNENGEIRFFDDISEARKIAAQRQLEKGCKYWIASLERTF